MRKKIAALALSACAVAALVGVGCSSTGSGGPAGYVYDTAAYSESADLAKYDWYSVDQAAGTLTVTLPAQDGYSYGCNVFNEDVMGVQSEKTEGGNYTVVFEKKAAGKTSLDFYGYTDDTGRTDSTAVLEVDVSDSGQITVYYSGEDFAYDDSRFDCIPI